VKPLGPTPSPPSMAARIERKYERAIEAVFAQRHGPVSVFTGQTQCLGETIERASEKNPELRNASRTIPANYCIHRLNPPSESRRSPPGSASGGEGSRMVSRRQRAAWATTRGPVNMDGQLQSVIALTGMEPACKPTLTGVSRGQQVIDNASPRAIAAHERIVFAGKWRAL
jgi:hypothetical protein